jgi:hypothetical protein
MPTEYVEDKEMTDAVVEMLGELSYTEFNLIREHEVKIEVRSCVRVDKNGENAKPKADSVAVKRISDADKTVVDTDYIFIVDNSAWAEANELQRSAIIHKGLMKIEIEADEGGIKFKTKKPNVVEFTATISRFGAYTEPMLVMQEALTLASKQVARILQLKNP